jgi:outer membrane immunogenic protein
VSGFLGGGQIGFNWQGPGSPWVIGIEADASWTNADGEHTLFDGFVTLRTKMNWLATVTGRLGYAWDRVLLYAKGGVAFADEEHDFGFFVDLRPVASTGEKTRTGWTVGGGVEVAFAGNWSFKAEYNFMDFGDKDVGFTNQFGDFVVSARIDQQIHVAKVGLNYRFGGFGGPVVARY